MHPNLKGPSVVHIRSFRLPTLKYPSVNRSSGTIVSYKNVVPTHKPQSNPPFKTLETLAIETSHNPLQEIWTRIWRVCTLNHFSMWPDPHEDTCRNPSLSRQNPILNSDCTFIRLHDPVFLAWFHSSGTNCSKTSVLLKKNTVEFGIPNWSIRAVLRIFVVLKQ